MKNGRRCLKKNCLGKIWVFDATDACDWHWKPKLMLRKVSHDMYMLVFSRAREFSELLKVLGWPITGPRPMASVAALDQKKERFSLCFRHLLALDFHQHIDKSAVVRMDDSILLPLELMLKSLRKRFKYHFCGDRKTNSKEKVNVALSINATKTSL